MSKKISTILSLAILISAGQSKVLAQCNPAAGDPYSCIPEATAMERTQFFKNIKRTILTDMGGHANDFTFDTGKIKTVLRDLKTNGTYDGIRIYFALSDRKHKPGFNDTTLYLVLFPTTGSGLTDGDGKEISDDDEANGYIISENTFTKINLDKDHYVTKWINRYVDKVAPQIKSKLEKKYGIKLDETRSLWYSKRAIFSMDPPKPGLGPDLLTYLTTHPEINRAEINFASWTLDPEDSTLSFKLTLVFKFYEETPSGVKKNSKFLTFEIRDMINTAKAQIEAQHLTKDEERKRIAELVETYTDTGNPCKPYKCP